MFSWASVPFMRLQQEEQGLGTGDLLAAGVGGKELMIVGVETE